MPEIVTVPIGDKQLTIETGKTAKQKEIYEKMKNIKSIAIGDSFQLYPIKSVALEIELGRKTEKYSRCEECSGCDFKEV